ncbi:hypothetical protein DWZ34_06235 [Phocaeicola plebeius]|jgi:hypothetical protein|uniref:IPT/TIG domain-containing protein n=2 Tax=Phocaeicola plebeius TaxID=310297 RepID=A0A415TA08_9BACT|nr:hypothetical protein [Phocaeicola plebeius]RHM98193.1 hypothetical protein DWZ34_06235 [Phocaeicola plebeius]
MNKIYKFSAWWMACLVLLSSLTFTACDTNDVDTNQYKGGISLNVFGPSPVLRGGELRFLGCGMDQVASVLIPGCDAITDIQLISAEEIRVIVPQTALPGYVTLMLRNGESIVTKTQLTYSEPVSIESFSPESVRPGDVLTIKGEYLNLMHQVIFAENVIVSDEVIAEEETTEATSKFLKHTRNEIQVRVPEEAQSGKIILSDGAEIPNRLYSEVELQVVLPSVAEVADYNNIKPGAIMTVTGENFDLVKEVRMENGETMLFTYSAEQKALTFTIPCGAVNGPIYVVPASGVLVQVAEIKMATPEDVKAQETEITAGKELTLTGKNMDMIAAVLFPGVEKAVEPTSLSETKVKVVVPGEAQSGMIQLVLTSGETIPGLELTVTAPKYCHIADENVLKTNDYFVGEDMVVDVVNIGELAEVQVAGTKVNYTSSGSQLTIPVPETAGHDSSVELISKDGTCKKYTVSFTKVIWEGSFDIGDWGGNKALGWNGYDWSSVQPGTIITVYYTLDMEETNWQIKLGGCAIDWSPLPTIPSQILEAGSTRFSATLTAEDLLVLSQDNNAGLVVSGCNFTMTKVTLK